MSAFDSGFRMGMGAFQQALENKQREEELGWKRADRARLDRQNAEVDAETANVKAMLSPAPGSDAAAMAQQGVGAVLDGGAADAGVAPSPIAAQGIGLSAPASSNQGPTPPSVMGVLGNAPTPSSTGRLAESMGARAFTDLDRLKGMQRLALASRDMNAVERLGGQIKTAEMDKIFGDAVKGWESTPERLDEVAKYVNSHPSLTMHAPDKNGMVPLSIVNADGRATLVHLNAAQLGQLAGADALMRAGHVQRGLEVVQGINEGLAKVLDTKNNLTNTVAKNQNTAAYQGGQLDLGRMQAGENARHNLASESNQVASRVASQGNIAREERMRYTSLLGETSRRLAETQKSLATLQKDPLYSMAKPGSPQHTELQGLRDTIATLSEERKTYQGMLAGSQSANASAAATAGGGSVGNGGKPSWQSSEAHNDQVMLIQSELDKARASGRKEDATALERELKRLGVEPGQGIAKGATLQKLPDGAKQIGTSGGRPVFELPDGRRVISQ